MDQLRNVHPGMYAGAPDADVARAETERAHRPRRRRGRDDEGGWIRRLLRRAKKD